MEKNAKHDGDNNNNRIDTLLERYLVLLDEYTTLRSDLSRLQAQSFQHLARANFAAERGARYGADFYDERMQASRRVVVHVSSSSSAAPAPASAAGLVHGSSPTFRVVTLAGDEGAGGARTSDDDDDDGRGKDVPAEAEAEAEAPDSDPQRDDNDVETTQPSSSSAHDAPPPGKSQAAAAAEPASSSTSSSKDRSEQQKINKNDPLRWFGVLTPMALRQTQACAIQVVGSIIPRLVSVDAEMRDVEIEVRRARKRRAKAEAAEQKKSRLGQDEAVAAVERSVREDLAV